MKNHELFMKHMTGLSEMKNKAISEFILEAYWEDLKPYTDAQCSEAFTRARKELKFFPDISELIGFISGPQAPESDRAELAWAAVDKAVRAHGPWPSVQFDDPAIHATIQALGGWSEFQKAPSAEDWKWVGVSFRRLYPTMARQQADAPVYLVGQAEINQAAGSRQDLIRPPLQISTGQAKLQLEGPNTTTISLRG